VIVVDASVVAELLTRAPGAAVASARVLAPGEDLHAPHLIDLEVTSVLRRSVAAKMATAAAATKALAALVAFPMQRHGHDELLARIWQLRGNLTPYDAAYVALAEALAVPLVTFDGHLAQAPGNRATIELLHRP
jgi:predicted nucleic acid-binding protein